MVGVHTGSPASDFVDLVLQSRGKQGVLIKVEPIQSIPESVEIEGGSQEELLSEDGDVFVLYT